MKKQKKCIVLTCICLSLLFGSCNTYDIKNNQDTLNRTTNLNLGVSESYTLQNTEYDENRDEKIKDELKEIYEIESSQNVEITKDNSELIDNLTYEFDWPLIPSYSGNPYIELNNNIPLFGEDEKVTIPFEKYSELDYLGRCGIAYANICMDIIPTEERGEIGSVRPSGWHTIKYNDLIEGNYLYNRCHLIAYQLAGENANIQNLITGTRYLNIQGMLPFENKVADYVENTKNHVLYRVNPIFEGDNLVASGVTMEALSIEDNGEGICFFVYVYNVQPGIKIEYATGESCREEETGGYSEEKADEVTKPIEKLEEDIYVEQNEMGYYILNTNTHKFHLPTCVSISSMVESNKKVSNETREEIINQGFNPCKRCKP